MGIQPKPAFGPYRLDAVIARSDTATVYRATDARHGGRTVALKVFGPGLSADRDFQERFRRDAALLGALRQPHVVPIHSYGVLNGLVYVDMRLIDGSTLSEGRRRGGLDANRDAVVVDQLSGTIAALHAAAFGPRAISSADVLLSGSKGHEFVYLVGLGLGRPVKLSSRSRRT